MKFLRVGELYLDLIPNHDSIIALFSSVVAITNKQLYGYEQNNNVVNNVDKRFYFYYCLLFIATTDDDNVVIES